MTLFTIYISFLSFQLSSSDVDYSIDQTLGDFNDAAPLFGSDTIQFMGITSFGPQTPITPRQMPPLAYPQPKQQQSPAFNSNGITSSSQSQVAYNRPYNNINNNNNPTINNNNTSNNVNNYNQLKTSSSAPLILAPPPQSRANSNNNSITPSNSNTFVRPPDSKPLMNGRSAYTTASQSSKHEVNITNCNPLLRLRVRALSPPLGKTCRVKVHNRTNFPRDASGVMADPITSHTIFGVIYLYSETSFHRLIASIKRAQASPNRKRNRDYKMCNNVLGFFFAKLLHNFTPLPLFTLIQFNYVLMKLEAFASRFLFFRGKSIIAFWLFNVIFLLLLQFTRGALGNHVTSEGAIEFIGKTGLGVNKLRLKFTSVSGFQSILKCFNL